MITETYRGRKLKAAKGREWGTLRVLCNGVPVAWPYGRGERAERAALDSVRAVIDSVDQDPVVDGGRWGAEWYAPRTYEMCAEGIHPMAAGGPCRHPYCQRKLASELGAGHGAAGAQPYGDLDAGGEALLMDALGETGPTTEGNQAFRLALLDAYVTAYDEARQR